MTLDQLPEWLTDVFWVLLVLFGMTFGVTFVIYCYAKLSDEQVRTYLYAALFPFLIWVPVAAVVT